MENEKDENVTFEVEREVRSTVDERNEYKYTKVDCLDEDAPIPGQRFVLLSFISPEGIMNCKVRGLKVRGVYDDYTKAQKMADKLNKADKYHHIYVGEVGKWMPWDPTPEQVEEEKYADENLNKIMRKAHESELKNQLNDLNELAGRHKENMELKEEQHEDRVKEKLKQGAKDFAKSGQTQTAAPEQQQTQTDDAANQKAGLNRSHNRNIEATKERLRKKVEERQQAKEAASLPAKKKELEEKAKKLREETDRISAKQQDVEKLKEERERIEASLKKMKEMHANKSA